MPRKSMKYLCLGSALIDFINFFNIESFMAQKNTPLAKVGCSRRFKKTVNLNSQTISVFSTSPTGKKIRRTEFQT